MKYLVCMPIYKMTDRVRKGFETLGIPRENILVISFDPACRELEDRAEVIITDENIGCSRAWNMALQKHHDWTFIVSSSMIYPEGFSGVLDVLARSGEDEIFLTQHSYHCSALNPKCIDRVGYFDENFYPAYFEDTDYEWRITLAGDHWNKIHNIPATCQQDGAATLDGLRPNYEALQDYYREKWGTVWTDKVQGEHWKHPFNNPDNELSYWPRQSIKQLKKKYELV